MLVGAFEGIAVNADPPLVHVYENGAIPPVIATVAEPVAVAPHGCWLADKTTFVNVDTENVTLNVLEDCIPSPSVTINVIVAVPD